MGLPAEANTASADRSHLWASFRVRGRTVGEVSSRSGQLRWGPAIGVEFTYPAEALSGVEFLFRSDRRGARLLLREGMQGELRVGRGGLPLQDLSAWGLTRGGKRNRWVRLTRDMSGEFQYRGVDVSFHFGPPPQRASTAPRTRVPLRFRRGFLAREEWPFAILAWCLYGILLYLGLTLSSLELPEEPAPERVAQRFAKLIYEAPQAPTPARSELLKKSEEAAAEEEVVAEEEAPEPEPEVAEEEPAPAAEEAPPEPVAEPEVAQEAETPPVDAAPEPAAPPDPGKRREEIRKRVASKGLLGLLGGRGAASTASRTRGSILDGRGAAADLDKVLESVEGLRTAEPDGDAAGDGLGSQGAGLGGDIDAAAQQAVSAGKRAVQLEQRQEQVVEAKEEIELDELTLKDAVAAIHKAVGTHLGGIRYLYNRELRKNPDLEGKLTVRITLNPQGEVLGCEVVESTLDAPTLEQAILKRIGKWQLPAVAPRVMSVTYPFVFFPSM